MFTHEIICNEIKSLKEGPVTPSSVAALAGLLYIQKHVQALPDDAQRKHDSQEHGMTRDAAMEWVKGMKNADGTTGPHWTMEKTEDARLQRGIDCEPLAFYVSMNMVYSDYVKVAEKVGASSLDFYAYMAEAFLRDKDSKHTGMGKLEKYYEYVVH